jgi:hypothetical protein
MRLHLALLFALLGLCAVWGVRHLADAHAAEAAAARGLADCRRYAERISHLRGRPALAAQQERRSAEISAPIEGAAKEAGIPTDRLLRISPEPARRIGETAYKEKPTRVIIKNVTLRKVVAMAHGLTGGEGELNLKSLRLTAPSPDAVAGTWSAELVFTYLIYEPQRTPS